MYVLFICPFNDTQLKLLMCLILSLLFHLPLSLKGCIDHAALWSMLQPAPPPSLLNIVNNRNGVISAAPREMAAQL